jgi:hypothetical protein
MMAKAKINPQKMKPVMSVKSGQTQRPRLNISCIKTGAEMPSQVSRGIRITNYKIASGTRRLKA